MSPLFFASLDVPNPCHERQKHSSDISSRLETGVERLPKVIYSKTKRSLLAELQLDPDTVPVCQPALPDTPGLPPAQNPHKQSSE